MHADTGAIIAVAVLAGFILNRLAIRLFPSPARRVADSFEKFLDDWNGKPERRTPDGARLLEDRIPGMPERMQNVEGDIAHIKTLLNGGGLGARMEAIDGKLTEHIETADGTREQIVKDVRQVRRDLGDAVMRLANSQQKGEERLSAAIEEVDGKVDDLRRDFTERLVVLEERDRAQTSILHEVGIDTELPPPRRDRP